jgi:hypothetical protein
VDAASVVRRADLRVAVHVGFSAPAVSFVAVLVVIARVHVKKRAASIRRRNARTGQRHSHRCVVCVVRTAVLRVAVRGGWTAIAVAFVAVLAVRARVVLEMWTASTRRRRHFIALRAVRAMVEAVGVRRQPAVARREFRRLRGVLASHHARVLIVPDCSRIRVEPRRGASHRGSKSNHREFHVEGGCDYAA